MSLSLDLSNGQRLDIGIRISQRARRFRLVSGIEGVHAVVPRQFDRTELTRFAESKRDWLLKTSKYYHRLKEKCGGYEPGTMLFQGQRYRCNLVADRRLSAVLSDSMKLITFHVPDTRKSQQYQQEWYRGQTAAIISERLPKIAERMGLKYNKVSIKKQKSRWGSCSKKGNLNFNLMLAAAPPSVIDYVIIHELAHLVVLDHSPTFWKTVSKEDPDFATHREWLSNFAPLIRIA